MAPKLEGFFVIRNSTYFHSCLNEDLIKYLDEKKVLVAGMASGLESFASEVLETDILSIKTYDNLIVVYKFDEQSEKVMLSQDLKNKILEGILEKYDISFKHGRIEVDFGNDYVVEYFYDKKKNKWGKNFKKIHFYNVDNYGVIYNKAYKIIENLINNTNELEEFIHSNMSWNFLCLGFYPNSPSKEDIERSPEVLIYYEDNAREDFKEMMELFRGMMKDVLFVDTPDMNDDKFHECTLAVNKYFKFIPKLGY